MASAPWWRDYAASKGAIDTFTLGLAREVAAEGIRVNAVAPGLIETEIHASSGEPGRVERLKAGVPMQRGGHPDAVARAVLVVPSVIVPEESAELVNTRHPEAQGLRAGIVRRFEYNRLFRGA